MPDFFNKWKEGLARTRKVTFGRIVTLFGGGDITDATWDEVEASMIQADLGFDTTESIINSMRECVFEEGLTRTEELTEALRKELVSRLDPPPDLNLTHKP